MLLPGGVPLAAVLLKGGVPLAVILPDGDAAPLPVMLLNDGVTPVCLALLLVEQQVVREKHCGGYGKVMTFELQGNLQMVRRMTYVFAQIKLGNVDDAARAKKKTMLHSLLPLAVMLPLGGVLPNELLPLTVILPLGEFPLPYPKGAGSVQRPLGVPLAVMLPVEGEPLAVRLPLMGDCAAVTNTLLVSAGRSPQHGVP